MPSLAELIQSAADKGGEIYRGAGQAASNAVEIGKNYLRNLGDDWGNSIDDFKQYAPMAAKDPEFYKIYVGKLADFIRNSPYQASEIVRQIAGSAVAGTVGQAGEWSEMLGEMAYDLDNAGTNRALSDTGWQMPPYQPDGSIPNTMDMMSQYSIPVNLLTLAGIISAPDAGDVARVQGALKTIKGRPALKDVMAGEVLPPKRPATQMVRTRVGTTGRYIGSPNINNPSQLGAMRNNLQESLKRGVIGRHWYDRTSKSTRELTSNLPNQTRQYRWAIAATSPDTAVAANAGHSIKGYNQLNTGSPVNAGRYPVEHGGNIATLADMDPRLSPSARVGPMKSVTAGPKTYPFFEAVGVDASNPVSRPTNDVWMGRAFGYESKAADGTVIPWSSGYGDAQHRFMDAEMERLTKWANDNKIGGYDDWTPERVQASIWVDTKARWEGTNLERAAEDFASNLDNRSINITSENAPALSLNHMVGVTQNPENMSLMDAMHTQAFTDEAGRDLFAAHARALTRPQLTGGGSYGGESNAVDVSRILGGTETGANTLDPASRKMAETVGAVKGMVKGQESVGYNFLRPAKRAAERNAAIGPMRDISEVTAKLDKAFPYEQGTIVIATPSGEGVRYLAIDVTDGPGKNAPKALTEAQQKVLKGIIGNKETQWAVNSGGLIGQQEFGAGFKPSTYLPYIDPYVAANMDDFTRWSASAAEAIDSELARVIPDAGVRNPILQKTRELLASGGVDAIREAVKQGVLPAVVLSSVLGLLQGREQNQEDPDAI